MSIIFGNLTESFVNFGTAEESLSPDDPTALQNLENAAAGFRHSASQDALILVYIGIGMLAATFTYMYTWVYTGEIVSKRIREKYLKVSFFDNKCTKPSSHRFLCRQFFVRISHTLTM